MRWSPAHRPLISVPLTASMLTILAACEPDAQQQIPTANDSLYALTQAEEHVAFLPPLGPEFVPNGWPFDGSRLARLQVVLESTRADGSDLRTEGVFDRTTTPPLVLLAQHELYFVNVPAAQYFTDPSRSYRFRFLQDGDHELGFSDLTGHVFEVLRWVPQLKVGVKLRLERGRPTVAWADQYEQNPDRPELGLQWGSAIAGYGGQACVPLMDALPIMGQLLIDGQVAFDYDSAAADLSVFEGLTLTVSVTPGKAPHHPSSCEATDGAGLLLDANCNGVNDAIEATLPPSEVPAPWAPSDTRMWSISPAGPWLFGVLPNGAYRAGQPEICTNLDGGGPSVESTFLLHLSASRRGEGSPTVTLELVPPAF